MLPILQVFGLDGSNLFSMGFVVLLVAVVLTYWVYNDATGRGTDNAALWALGVGILTLLTLVGGLLAFAVYIWKR